MSSRLSKLILILVVLIFAWGVIFFYSPEKKIEYDMTAQIGGKAETLEITKLGSIDVSDDTIWDIAVQGDYAYIAGSWNGLYVVDISNPTSPYLVKNLPVTESHYNSIDVAGNYVYVTRGLDRMEIIDISVPSNPVRVGEFEDDLTFYARDIMVKGDFAYMVGSNNYIEVIDVSDPSNPQLHERFVGQGLSGNEVEIVGSRLYSADHNVGLFPLNIKENGTLGKIFPGLFTNMCIGWCYTVGANENFVAMPSKISANDNIKLVIAKANSITSSGVGDYIELALEAPYLRDVTINGNYLFLTTAVSIGSTDKNKLEIFDLTKYSPNVSLSEMRVLSHEIAPYPYKVKVVGDYIYILHGATGLEIYQLSAVTPNNPPSLNSISSKSINEGKTLTFTISATDPDGDTLTYSATGLPNGASLDAVTHTFTWTPTYEQSGTHNVEFSVSDGSLSDTETVIITVNKARIPLEITKLGSFDFSDSTYDIFVQGDYLYLIDNHDGLFIVDISDPANATLTGKLSFRSDLPEIYVEGNYAYVTESSGFQLQIIDVSNPAHPQVIKGVDTFPGERYAIIKSLVVKDGFAYLLDDFIEQGLKIVDVSQPNQPVLKENILLWGKGQTIKESNNILAIGYMHTINQVGGGFCLKRITQPGKVEGILCKGSTAQIGKTLHDAVGINKDWAAVSGEDSSGEKALFVIDISTQEMNVQKIGTSLQDIAIYNDYVFVLFLGEDPFTDNSVVGVYDLSNFDTGIISEVKRFEVPQWARIMKISNNRLYVMDYYGEVQIYQLSTVTPNQPPVLKIYNPIVYLGDKIIKNIDLEAGEQISLKEGKSISISVNAADTDSVVEDLAFSVHSNTMPPFDLSNPSGPYFNPIWQTFTWHTDYADAGVYDLTFTVTDGELSDSETLTLTILDAGSAPVLQKIGDKSVEVGKALNFTISATDPDGDELNYSAVHLPQGAAFNATTRTFSWTPSSTQIGSYDVTFLASDQAFSVSETITITVSEQATTPTATSTVALPSISVEIAVKDEFSQGEIIQFDYTISSDKNVQIIYSAYLECNDNMPVRSSTLSSTVLEAEKTFTKSFYGNTVSGEVISQTCTAFLKILSPINLLETKDFQIVTAEIQEPTAGEEQPTVEEQPVTEEKPITEMTVSELKAKITELLSKMLILQKELAVLRQTPSYPEVPPKFRFTRNIMYGMIGWDVHYLQIILKTEVPSAYPAVAGITGWFGPTTKRAAAAFQEKYSQDILAPLGLKRGTGFVGKSTISKLNQLLGVE